MNSNRKRQLLLEKLKRPGDEIRHRLLDLLDDLLDALANAEGLSPAMTAECDEVRRALEAVRPRFPSHRTTSILFDREGLGQAGRKRAKELLKRSAALLEMMTTGSSH